MEIEGGTNCPYDYLDIRNGGYETSPRLVKLCGEDIDVVPGPYYTSTYQSYVIFSSDMSVVYSGAVLLFEEISRK